MWNKFFAFSMLVLVILSMIQLSTLSDKDVEKIRAHIEAQRKVHDPASTDEFPETIATDQTDISMETNDASDRQQLQ